MAYTLKEFGGLALVGPAGPVPGGAAQRRSLALLAIIASGRARGVSRAKLTGLLWGHSDEDRARGALAQTLYRVRQTLGADAITGSDQLRLNPELLVSEAGEFEDALERGELERAVRLYAGPFLDGFYLPNAPELEGWIEAERSRLTHRYREALERLAAQAGARGAHAEAADWWRALAAADPLNSRVAARLVEALAASGNTSGALQAARVHEALVRSELGSEPDAGFVAAVASVRERLDRAAVLTHPASVAPVSSTPRDAREPATPTAAADSAPIALDEPRPASRPRGRIIPWRARGWAVTALGAVAIAVAVVASAPTLAHHSAHGRTTVAVGEITDLTEGDTAGLAHALPELLTTSLGRFGSLQVVSRPRLYELAAETQSPLDRRGFGRAAARAGASLLLEGTLYRRPAGRVRLDLRLMNLERGMIERTYRLEGDDPFALADSAASRVAGDLDGTASTPTAPGVTVRSLVALQLYEEGLRAYYAGDPAAAERLFVAALNRDSTFAMAAYYAYNSAFANWDRALVYLRQALRSSEWATDRERLIIRATWATINDEPEALVLAESLSTRYPADPAAHVLLGNALLMSGDFGGAALAFRQALAMNANGLRDGATVCAACDAVYGLVDAYLLADSLESAERAARDWVRKQPSSARAWLALASVLDMRNDTAGAAAAFRRRLAVVPYAPEESPLMVTIALRAGDFERAERLLAGARASQSEAVRREALWWLTIARRYEGRLEEALRSAAALRTDPSARQLYGQVLLELGRAREAAAVFASVERDWRAAPATSEAVRSRRLTWAMAHRATALAAAGDTAMLAQLIEPMREIGERSGYGRDRRLHHYARGLLLKARGRREEAVAEFRAAMFSPNLGYTRVNLELGRLCLDLGRPYDAIAVLSPALRGSLEASNLYVTHTEVHALLARAFAATGASDSAAVHDAYVARALAHSDPGVRARFALRVARP